MLKILTVLGLSSAMVALSPLAQDGRRDPDRDPGAESPVPGPSSAEPVAPAVAAKRPSLTPASLGLLLAPVPELLARHLELAPGVGSLVERVEPGSPAAEAGLEPLDVIVAVDGRDAEPEVVGRMARQPGGTLLRVVRAGVARQVPLSFEGDAEPDPFLSWNDLPADHPFRRFGELAALREDYSTEVERYGERLRDLEQESRRTQEEARREIKALEAEAAKEIAAYLADVQKEYVGLVDERLADERLLPLLELCLNPEELLPAERTKRLRKTVADAVEQLDKGFDGRLGVVPDEGARDRARQVEQRLKHVVDEMAQLLRQRVQCPLDQVLERTERDKGRLSRHGERMKWTDESLTLIRKEVAKRIVCACERTQDALSKKLASRLQKLDLPRPGEIQGALADIRAQIDDMTRRFVTRTEAALLTYESGAREANEALVPALAGCLARCEEAAARLGPELDSGVGAHLGSEPLSLRDDWRDAARLRDLEIVLRKDLLGLVDRERDATLAGARGIARALEEHETVTEDAWEDLRRLLGELRQESANDCWKLDGPHLDGRFPQDDAAPGSRGEVALNRR